MREQGCRGPPGTRRLEGESCDSSGPARGLNPGQRMDVEGVAGCGSGRDRW